MLTSTSPGSNVSLWELRSNKAFDEIRAALCTMNGDLEHCMYCECNEAAHIDHFDPKARNPFRCFDWTNYLLACDRCNSNYKRDQFPLDASGQSQLVNPAEEDPRAHLILSPKTGKYIPVPPKGQPTIKTFGLDRAHLERGRHDAWRTVEVQIVEYARHADAGDPLEANLTRQLICRHPFVSVFLALLEIADGPGAPLILADCRYSLSRHPDIYHWL